MERYRQKQLSQICGLLFVNWRHLSTQPIQAVDQFQFEPSKWSYQLWIKKFFTKIQTKFSILNWSSGFWVSYMKTKSVKLNVTLTGKPERTSRILQTLRTAGKRAAFWMVFWSYKRAPLSNLNNAENMIKTNKLFRSPLAWRCQIVKLPFSGFKYQMGQIIFELQDEKSDTKPRYD